MGKKYSRENPPPHGIPTRYSYYGCRCTVCKEGWYTYNRSRINADPQKFSASQRRYREEHPQEVRAAKKQWYEQNRDYVIAKTVKWQQDHPERTRENQQRYGRSEKRRAWATMWRKANPDRIREYQRKFFRSEHGRLMKIIQNHQRRSRDNGLASEQQIRWRVEFFGGKCWICRDLATQIDHVIPLARGGTNWPANLRPICKPCNLSKGARHWQEVA